MVWALATQRAASMTEGGYQLPIAPRGAAWGDDGVAGAGATACVPTVGVVAARERWLGVPLSCLMQSPVVESVLRSMHSGCLSKDEALSFRSSAFASGLSSRVTSTREQLDFILLTLIRGAGTPNIGCRGYLRCEYF